MRLSDCCARITQLSQHLCENISFNGKDVLIKSVTLLILCQVSTKLMRSWIGGPIVFSAVLLCMKPKSLVELERLNQELTRQQEEEARLKKTEDELSEEVTRLQAQAIQANSELSEQQQMHPLKQEMFTLTRGIRWTKECLEGGKTQLAEIAGKIERATDHNRTLFKKLPDMRQELETLQKTQQEQAQLLAKTKQAHDKVLNELSAQQTQERELGAKMAKCKKEHETRLLSLKSTVSCLAREKAENLRLKALVAKPHGEIDDPLSLFLSMTKDNALHILGLNKAHPGTFPSHAEIDEAYRAKKALYTDDAVCSLIDRAKEHLKSQTA